MDSQQTLFLQLLRAGIWNQEPPLDLFPVPAETWQQIYFIACKQTVQGLVYDAVCRLPESLRPATPLFDRWGAEIRHIEQTYLRHLRTYAWLSTRMLADAGPRPIVLKGLTLAACYPTPAHRVVGDIDLYYGSPEACEQANQCVERWGQRVQRGEMDEAIFMLGDVVIEHHGHSLLIHSPLSRRRLEAKVLRSRSHDSRDYSVRVEGMDIPTLSPIHDVLQLSMHSLKHVLNEGIGFRQLVDLALYLQHHHVEIDGEALRQTLRTFGILRWANLTFAFCVKVLGMSESFLPYSFSLDRYVPQYLLHEVWLTGNFGFMDERNADRPDDALGGKVFTARRMWRNSFRFFPYAPSEAFWVPMGALMTNIHDLFHKK